MCFLNFQLNYCKSRVMKPDETHVSNGVSRSHVSSTVQTESRPLPSVFIVPTRSQVQEMYIAHANASDSTAASSTRPCKPPPSYGAVLIDIPPSYEQAVARGSAAT